MEKLISCASVTTLRNATYLGISSNYQPIYASLEKISFVLDCQDDIKNETLINLLRRIRSDEYFRVRMRRSVQSSFDETYPYSSAIEIWLSEKSVEHPVLLTIYSLPVNKRSGGIRMELNSHDYSGPVITKLFVWLAEYKRLGAYFYLGLHNAWVTTIHYAVSIIDMKLKDYFINLFGVRHGEFKGGFAERKELTLGASRITATICEKVDAQWLCDRELYGKSWFKLEENEFRRFMHIELRLSPGKQELMLNNLLQMNNLVSRLRFYDRCALSDQELEPDFGWLLRDSPYPSARCKFSPASEINGCPVSPTKDAANARVSRVMSKYRAFVFDEFVIWDQLPQVVEKLGILAHSEYWQHNFSR